VVSLVHTQTLDHPTCVVRDLTDMAQSKFELLHSAHALSALAKQRWLAEKAYCQVMWEYKSNIRGNTLQSCCTRATIDSVHIRWWTCR